MKVVVTGAGGFIGRNLCATLDRIDGVEVNRVFSTTQRNEYSPRIKEADVIYHLAGVNRPKDPSEFVTGNTNFTREVLEIATEGGIVPTVVISSTIQAVKDNDYGKSKRAAEELIEVYASNGKIHGAIYRLPGVFGKWSRPNYNSVVSTFCHNVANELPLEVRDPSFALPLVYVDDIVQAFLSHLNSRFKGLGTFEVTPVFNTTLGELPCVLTHTARPQQLPILVRQDYTDIGPVTISINHADHLVFILVLLFHKAPEFFNQTTDPSLWQINPVRTILYKLSGSGIIIAFHIHLGSISPRKPPYSDWRAERESGNF